MFGAIGSTIWKAQFTPTTRYQSKFLVANTSTGGNLTDLTFNNLTIGKTYRIGLHVDWQGTAAKRIDITHNSVVLTRLEMSTGVTELNTFTSKIFVATASTLTFNFTTAASQLQGGDAAATCAVLEESPIHELTTSWT